MTDRLPCVPIADRSSNDLEWRAAHGSAVGSADARVIHGAGYSEESGIRLWQRLAEGVGYADRSDVDEDTIDWWDTCSRLEGFILDELRDSGAVAYVEPNEVLFRSVAHPLLVSTPDAFVSLPNGPKIPCEIKVVRELDAIWRETGEPPAYLRIQAQHHMAVTAAGFCLVVVFAWGVGIRYALIERDSDWIEQVHVPRVEELFLALEDNASPPLWLLEGPAKPTASALGDLYAPSEAPKAPLTLDGEWVDIDDRIRDLEATGKEMSDAADRLKNRIRLAIGKAGAEEAHLPNGVRWTWKATKAGHRRLLRKDP